MYGTNQAASNTQRGTARRSVYVNSGYLSYKQVPKSLNVHTTTFTPNAHSAYALRSNDQYFMMTAPAHVSSYSEPITAPTVVPCRPVTRTNYNHSCTTTLPQFTPVYRPHPTPQSSSETPHVLHQTGINSVGFMTSQATQPTCKVAMSQDNGSSHNMQSAYDPSHLCANSLVGVEAAALVQVLNESV